MFQDINVLSISELDLESPLYWKIVAKVDNLSPIIPDGRTGRYFFVDLSDATGTIRGVAYKSVADRLHKKLKENSVYSIENGVIHRVKPEYKINNEYAITFKEYSDIIQIDEELINNVAKHGKLLSKEKDSSVVSQSQNNALLAYRSPKSLAKDKVFEICKRLEEIKNEELELAMEKLKLKNERDSILK